MRHRLGAQFKTQPQPTLQLLFALACLNNFAVIVFNAVVTICHRHHKNGATHPRWPQCHAAMHAFAASLVFLPSDDSAAAEHLPIGELFARGGP